MKTKIKNKKTKIQEAKELLILIIVAFTIKTCLIEIYVVPTPSMEKTILVGDMLIGNKFIYGMRTPNWIGVPYTRFGFYIPSFRLPKFKEVQEGDVVIFEFPRDPFQKYVKRCIGLPGDKVKIENGVVFRNSKKVSLPPEGQFTTKNTKSSANIHDKNHYNMSIPYNIPYAEFNNTTNEGIILDTLFIKTKMDTRRLYPLFSEELIDESSNMRNIDVLHLPFTDRNGNGKWDYGNEDNISEFVVPFKGQKISFDGYVNWKHVINLLLLDGANMQVKIGTNVYTFSNESPFERSRLSGIVKYEILKRLYSLTRQTSKLVDLHKSNQNSIDENYIELQEKMNSEGLINPWNLNLTYDSNNNPILSFGLHPLLLPNPTLGKGNIYEIDENFYTTSGNPVAPNNIIRYEELMQSFEEIKSDLVSFSPYEHLYINNTKVSKDFKYNLKNNYYFLIGDNRNQSSDCRYWGFVPDYHILGAPIFALINVDNPIKNIRFKPIK